MEACIITDREQWNSFVTSMPNGNITQSFEWGELALHIGAHETLRIGVKDNRGNLCAAMMIFLMKIPWLNSIYFYAPRGPIILHPDTPAMAALLNYTRAEAYKHRAFMLKIEPGAPEDPLAWKLALRRRGFRINPHVMHVRSEWVLDIRPDEKTLLSQMKEKWRYNIRLAARKGITISETHDFSTFYKIYQTTSIRDRFFIHPQSHYEDVFRLFYKHGHAKLLFAEYEGQAIASTMTLIFGQWSWYMYGASSNEQRERMPNHLLQWTAIQWAKEQGCHFYNFRGIPDKLEEGNEMWGVYQFKRGFGGFPVRALETHDLVYQPVIYEAYRRLLDLKRWNEERIYRQQSRLDKTHKTMQLQKTLS